MSHFVLHLIGQYFDNDTGLEAQMASGGLTMFGRMIPERIHGRSKTASATYQHLVRVIQLLS